MEHNRENQPWFMCECGKILPGTVAASTPEDLDVPCHLKTNDLAAHAFSVFPHSRLKLMVTLAVDTAIPRRIGLSDTVLSEIAKLRNCLGAIVGIILGYK